MNQEMQKLPFTILLADDDDDDIMLTQDAMDTAGIKHEVSIVKDGRALLDHLEEAISNVKSNIPNIILLDLNMPIMDGKDVLRAIKKVEAYKAIPVVILSTSEEMEDINESYALGASGYFSKPNSFDDLVQLMQALNRYWYEWANLPKNIH